jgi:hypothetical protein
VERQCATGRGASGRNASGLNASGFNATVACGLLLVAIPFPGARPPDPVPAATAQPGDHAIAVSWTPPAHLRASRFVSYTAVASGTAPGGSCQATSPAATGCSISGLTPGTGYTVSVYVTNRDGTSVATVATPDPVSPTSPYPDAPTGVTADAGSGSVIVSWIPPSTVEAFAEYRAYALLPDGTVAGICSAPTVTATSCTITGLAGGIGYTVEVFTITTTSNSYPAVAGSVQTPFALPQAPTGVRVTAADHALDVAWTAPADAGTGVLVGYIATAQPTEANDPFTCTAIDGGCRIDGLTAGTAYQVTVVAQTTVGSSPLSVSAVGTPFALPGPPMAVSATTGPSSVAVSWSPPVDPGTGAPTGYTAVVNPGGQSCTAVTGHCTINGLSPATSYVVTVVLHTTVGDSPLSDSVTVETAYARLSEVPTGGVAAGVVLLVVGCTIAAGVFLYTYRHRPEPEAYG